MGGKTPSTFADGILSGLGHPIIGPDHLAFLIALVLAIVLLRPVQHGKSLLSDLAWLERQSVAWD